jgi:hypothetical protein
MAWEAGKMAIHKDHEIHQRRFGRNLGLALVLGAFVVLLMGLTVVKVTTEGRALAAQEESQ